MARDRCKVASTRARRIARQARKLGERCRRGTLACPMSAREQLGRAEEKATHASMLALSQHCGKAEALVRYARDAYERASKSISQSKAVKTRRIVAL